MHRAPHNSNMAMGWQTAEEWDLYYKNMNARPLEWGPMGREVLTLLFRNCVFSMNSNILVTGCGVSTLSADLYDAGFPNIMSIDVSRVAILEMMRKYTRSHPNMLWRLMDMTEMKLEDNSIQLVIDKGGLDSVLGHPDPATGADQGVIYLSEVKRVLTPGGSYVGITFANHHGLDVLVGAFGEGWNFGVWNIPSVMGMASHPLQPFMIVAKNESRARWPLISLDLGWEGVPRYAEIDDVIAFVDRENLLRSQKLPLKTHLRRARINPMDPFENLHPGRSLLIDVGNHGSTYSYAAIIMDLQEYITPNMSCAVYFIPQGPRCPWDWLFSSTKGQWQISESVKAGRLLMVSLDPKYDVRRYGIEDVKDDLLPLLRCFFTLDCRPNTVVIPFFTETRISQRIPLDIVTAPMIGDILVEDVVMEDTAILESSSLNWRRRMTFKRNPDCLRANGHLIKANNEEGVELKVDHSYLGCSHYECMIAAFTLVSTSMEAWIASNEELRCIIVGLGGGLLPMFIHNYFPFDEIQVVEVDPLVGTLAKRHFGFIEDDRLKLVIGDGFDYIQSLADRSARGIADRVQKLVDAWNEEMQARSKSSHRTPRVVGEMEKEINAQPNPLEHHVQRLLEQLEKISPQQKPSLGGKRTTHFSDVGPSGSRKQNLLRRVSESRVHVIIIDIPSSEDPSCGLGCPPLKFKTKNFLIAVQNILVEGGLFMVNLIANATAHYVSWVEQLKTYFEEVYVVEVEKNTDHILVAIPHPRSRNTHVDINVELYKLERSTSTWLNKPNLSAIVRERIKRIQ